ncbi:hypothetical protein PFZ49_10060 [Microbacterium lacticum]|uniref:hypothetical protein n=1 Tax=Microbacterium lacticum TaxID=33885 RepID=UPI003A83BC36
MSDDEIKRMLEQTLIPPLGTVELDPSSIKASASRLGDARGTEGERYHLASGLTPAGAQRTLPEATVSVVREFYFTTATEGAQRMTEERSNRVAGWADLAPDLARVFAPCWTEPQVVAALYGVDVLVVADGRLWRQVPGRPDLVFEGTWSEQDTLALQQAIPGAPDLSGSDRAFAFLTAAITRSQFVHGERGYRSSLMSAGMVASGLLRACLISPGTGWRPALVETFIDRDVNDLLRNDGVDRGVVAVVLLSRAGEPPVRDNATDRHGESR